MAAVSNDASLNGLADGTLISSSNNGGGTNTLMTLTGNGGVERKTATTPPGDTACYEFPAKTTSAGALAFTPGGFGSTLAAGFWLYFDAAPAPANSQSLLRFSSSSNANELRMGGAGKLAVIINTATAYTSTVALAAQTWYWVTAAFSVASAVGQARFGIYNTAGTLLDSFTSAALQNTSGIGNGTVQYGKIGTLAGLPLSRMTSFRANTDNASLIAPVMTPPPTPVAPPQRGWGMVA